MFGPDNATTTFGRCDRIGTSAPHRFAVDTPRSGDRLAVNVMHTLRLLVLVIVIGGAAILGLSAKTVSLYVAEHQIDARGCADGVIVHEVVIVDGIVTAKQEILRFKPTTGGTFDGTSTIIGNRWVVSPDGHILDLVEHRLVFGDASIYDFLGIDGSTAYYRLAENAITGTTGTDVFAFKLKAGAKLEGVPKLSFFLRERIGDSGRKVFFAPSRTKYAIDDSSGGEVVIRVVDVRGGRLLCRGVSTSVSMYCNSLSFSVPMIWLDEKTLLTQRKNGHLITVDMEGNQRNLVSIDCTSEPHIPPSLYFDRDGDVVYDCGARFRIDVRRRTATPYVWEPLGSGFAMAYGDKDTKRFRWRRKAIGALVCWGYESTTYDGLLATTYGARDGGGIGSPEGVAIWNSKTRQWTKIEFDWVDNVIGFVTHD